MPHFKLLIPMEAGSTTTHASNFWNHSMFKLSQMLCWHFYKFLRQRMLLARCPTISSDTSARGVKHVHANLGATSIRAEVSPQRSGCHIDVIVEIVIHKSHGDVLTLRARQIGHTCVRLSRIADSHTLQNRCVHVTPSVS